MAIPQCLKKNLTVLKRHFLVGVLYLSALVTFGLQAYWLIYDYWNIIAIEVRPLSPSDPLTPPSVTICIPPQLILPEADLERILSGLNTSSNNYCSGMMKTLRKRLGRPE